MSHVLILGATGSLGRHVLRQAIAAGHEVSVFVRTPSKLPSFAQAGVTSREPLTHFATRVLFELVDPASTSR